MLARFLGGMFGVKATVLSGVIVVASAVATGSERTTDVTPSAEESSPMNEPAAVVEVVPVAPTTSVISAAPARPVEAPRAADPSPTPPAAACAIDAQVREASLQTIRSSFANAQSALARLGSERTNAKATTAIERAGTMLVTVDSTAEALVGASVSCTADLREVTDRSVHAMEMIVDLAKTATAPAPTPAPTKKPVPTKKPEPTPKKP